jgi:hypothetical protein
MPPPQVLVQLENAPHGDTVQCDGQTPSKQVRVALVAGQFSLPSTRRSVTLRLRDCLPTLHEAEHGVQSDHGVILQVRSQLHSLLRLPELLAGHAAAARHQPDRYS